MKVLSVFQTQREKVLTECMDATLVFMETVMAPDFPEENFQAAKEDLLGIIVAAGPMLGVGTVRRFLDEGVPELKPEADRVAWVEWITAIRANISAELRRARMVTGRRNIMFIYILLVIIAVFCVWMLLKLVLFY